MVRLSAEAGFLLTNGEKTAYSITIFPEEIEQWYEIENPNYEKISLYCNFIINKLNKSIKHSLTEVQYLASSLFPNHNYWRYPHFYHTNSVVFIIITLYVKNNTNILYISNINI